MWSRGLKRKRHVKQTRWLCGIGLAVIAWMASLGLAAQSVDVSSVSGPYTQEGTSIHLFLSSSFGFILHTPGEHRPRTGNYTIDGSTLTLVEGAAGQLMVLTAQGGKLYDQDGHAWVKAEQAPAPAPQQAPATNKITIRDQAEFDAYTAASSQSDPAAKAAALESFIQAYPQSVVKSTVLDTLIDAYKQSRNVDKLFSAASRLLEADPNNIKAILYSVIIEKDQCVKTQDAQTCDDAAALAQRGLSIPKPAERSDADWQKLTAGIYPTYRAAIALARPAPAATAPQPAPAPMPAIAPPPPPADAPPPTIALGQTELQVTSAFGQPVRVAKLGVKEIYYYKDMKVTFTNSKVSNVE